MEVFLTVSVLLLCTLSAKDVYTCRVEVGRDQPANLTFVFERDYKTLDGTPNVQLKRSILDSSLPVEDLADCYWFPSGLECYYITGISISKEITDRLSISIKAVTKDKVGKYIVTLKPPVPGFDSSCVLSLRSPDDQDAEQRDPPTSRGNHEQKEKVAAPSIQQPQGEKPPWTAVIGLLIAILVVALLILLVIAIYGGSQWHQNRQVLQKLDAMTPSSSSNRRGKQPRDTVSLDGPGRHENHHLNGNHSSGNARSPAAALGSNDAQPRNGETGDHNSQELSSQTVPITVYQSHTSTENKDLPSGSTQSQEAADVLVKKDPQKTREGAEEIEMRSLANWTGVANDEHDDMENERAHETDPLNPTKPDYLM